MRPHSPYTRRSTDVRRRDIEAAPSPGAHQAMSVLIPLLFTVGLILLLRLSTGLTASRRLVLVLVSLALILIPLPAAFELGRTWDAHRREAAEGQRHRKEPII